MKTRDLLLGLASAVMLIYLFMNYNLNSIYNALLGINPFLIAFFIIGSVAGQFIKSLQWRVLIKIFTDFSFSKSFYALIFGTFSGRLTPGQVGDFGRGLILAKETKISKSKAMSTVLMDKLISYFAIFLICFVSIFLNVFEMDNLIYLISAFIFFLLLIFGFIIYIKKYKWFIKFVPKRFKERLLGISNRVSEAFKTLFKNKKILLLSFVISLIYWLFSFAISYLFLLGFGVNVPFQFVTMVFPLTTLISMLPISLSGFGVREISLVYFFELMNVPGELIITYSLLSSFIFLIIMWILSYITMLNKSLKI